MANTLLAKMLYIENFSWMSNAKLTHERILYWFTFIWLQNFVNFQCVIVGETIGSFFRSFLSL